MIGETRVDPDALTGRHKFRKDKAERMESVLEGRQDRSYGAAAGRKKQKQGEFSGPRGKEARLDVCKDKGY